MRRSVQPLEIAKEGRVILMTEPYAPSSIAPAAGKSRKLSSPLLGFAMDLLLALAVMSVLSLGCIFAWGIYRGFVVAQRAQQQGTVLQAGQIAGQIGQLGALGQMLVALLSTAAAALLLYFWRRRAGAEERQQSLAAAARPSTWGWTLLVSLLVLLLTSTVSHMAEALGIDMKPSNLAMVEQAMAQSPLFLLLFAVVLAPAYEELLFRRVLFGRLLQAGKPWLGMLLSSAAFALVHELPGISGNDLPAIIQLWTVYGLMGAAFAWLYKRTGTLLAPIAAHGLNNAFALLSLYWFGAS
jgi:membrane protease YdiL (CAAX protease family)